MNTIYLLRHGMPEFPNGQHCCLGLTDLPLSQIGVKQAEHLREYFRKSTLPVFASPLKRSVQTAEIIAAGRSVEVIEDLHELDAGLWDGLTFEQIRKEFPEYYKRRGEDPSMPPPGGESLSEGVKRIKRVIGQIRESAIIVSHCSLNRGIICEGLNLAERQQWEIPQPYGCINIIEVEGESFRPIKMGELPSEA